jgi:isopentenyldiphosphate isomerase
MSQDELVDIVDEEGNFIKVVSKIEAHRDGLLHACVIGQVINSKGEYMLIKQPADRQHPNQYVCPMGGHIESKESEELAVKRELLEELGMKEYTSQYIGSAIFNREVIGRKENHLFMLYKIFSDETPVLNHESESFKYFSEEDLKKEIKEHAENFGITYLFLVKRFFPNLL